MPKKILVVDDSESIRNILRLTLKFKGYEIEEAQNGQQAYELIQKNSYDLLISDIDMPILTGIDLLFKIRGELKNEKLPIIICTAEKLSNPDELIMKGANKWIAKPFTPTELLDAVSSLI